MKSKIPLLFVLMTLSGAAHAEGPGIGNGNGHPGENPVRGIPVQGMPVEKELLELTHDLAGEFPTVSARIRGLIHRFKSNDRYSVVYYPVRNEWVTAQSRNSDVKDSEGFPVSAVLSHYNEFTEMRPDRQVENMIHEFVHILTGFEKEERVDPIVTAIFEAAHARTTREVIELLRPLMQESSLGREAAAAYFESIESQTATAPIHDATCPGFTSEAIVFGGETLVFPRAPQGLNSKIGQDPFFKQYRDVCLEKSIEGRSLLHGAEVHPVILAELLRNVLGQPLRIVLSAEESELNASRPEEPGTFPGLAKAHLPAGNVIDVEQAGPAFESYRAWKKLRAETLAADEPVVSVKLSRGSILSLPIRYVQWKSLYRGQHQVSLLASGPAASTHAPLVWSTGSRDTATCQIQSSAENRLGLSCIYGGDTERRWLLDWTWAAAALRADAPEFLLTRAIEVR